MAEAIVSPGVFTNERDLSFLPTGIASIGAALVGPTTKGPAFVPTILTNYEDFKAMFGGASDDTYMSFAVKAYLQSAATVTVLRIVTEGGFKASGTVQLFLSGSDTLIGVIMPTTTVGVTQGTDYAASTASGAGMTDTNSWGVTGSVGFSLSGSLVTPAQTFTASLWPSFNSSIKNVLGNGVKNSNKGFLYAWFPEAILASGTGSKVYALSAPASTEFDLSGSVYGAYQPAATPWITSQLVGGSSVRLMKFLSLADGASGNTAVKVGIINTQLPGDNPASDYGSFNVVVRAYDDTDQKPNVLEIYTNCNLDPDSVNYVARRIGDRAYSVTSDGLVTLTGDYPNVSKYIRVSVTDDVASKSASPNLKPFGFEAVFNPVSGSLTLPAPRMVVNTGSAQYISDAVSATEIASEYNKKVYFGWNFASEDNANFLKAIPNGALANASGEFNLDTCFTHPDFTATSANTTIDANRSISGSTFKGQDIANVLKFVAPFQGGFDGMDWAVPKNVGEDITSTNVFGMDCSTAASKGTQAYTKALNILSNADEYDINLIATPGLNYQDHAVVINKAIEVAEERNDAFVLVDPLTLSEEGGVGTAISAISQGALDTSYAAAYWPWVKVQDLDRNKNVWVPPSAVLPAVFANSDSLAYEWFAPAGLNRGGIKGAVDAEYKLTQAQRAELYENRINAIAAFPNQGVVVWGQKTLQAKPSALDRVNVRRLLIAMKKYIASASRYLVFENNTTATRARFVNIVTPYLETVKARQGLYAYRVVMDETNNPPSVIDANQMYGQIFIQPAKSAEFIIIDFNILPTGASFENA